MSEKTKVVIQSEYTQSQLKKGAKGYIDGYTDKGYAYVVSGDQIDLVPIWSLKVLK